MTLHKYVMIMIVLLSVSGLLLGCGDDTIVTPTTEAEAPLLAPTNVTAQILANGTVELTWSSNSQTTLKGYNVYRVDQNAGAIGRINRNLLTVNHYTDTDTDNGHRYQYWVTAVSVKGIETGASPVASVDTQTTSGKNRGRDSH